jgi:type I restriction enzyme S subunit
MSRETGEASSASTPGLVTHFERVAGAPGGVARLRELILSLAVRGKLVPQDPSDEPASALLQRIREEKEGLIEDGKAKPLLPIADEEKPFALPEGWSWTRLREVVFSSEAGWSPSCLEAPRREGRWGVLKVSAVSWGSFDSTANKELPQELDPRPELEVRDGDFLLSRANTAELVARSVLVVAPPPMLMLSDKIIRLKLSPRVDTRYVNLFNNGHDARIYYAERASGTSSSMKNVSREVVLGLPVALPPLAEQSRIVARVDELMRLCDALEAKGRLEAEQHTRLLDTLLCTLTDSATPEELAANWQRVAEHFDLLLDRPEAVDALEQTILQLAVRGLLVPQDPNDEPASELVRHIRSYRDEQVKQGNAKRERPLAPLADADLPFELPAGWEWIRFDDLIEPAKPIAYGVLVPGPDVDRGVPFVRIADLSLTDPPAKPEKSISAEVDAQYQRTRLVGGEILMGVVGSIGKLGVAPPSWAGANIARAICRIVPVVLVNKDFVLLLLQSEFMRASFAGDTRTLAQPTLNVGLIRASATPLPPIAEQARIVARVTELRRLCTDLRERLAASQVTQSRLAASLVESFLV